MSNSSTSRRQTFGSMVAELWEGGRGSRLGRAKVGAVSPVNSLVIQESGTYKRRLLAPGLLITRAAASGGQRLGSLTGAARGEKCSGQELGDEVRQRGLCLRRAVRADWRLLCLQVDDDVRAATTQARQGDRGALAQTLVSCLGCSICR